MDPMKHLPYGHTVNRSLAETLVNGVRRMLPGSLQFPQVRSGPGSVRARLLVGLGWLIALAVQAALLLVIAELIEVVHGVMELYLDLAQQQLDLTSLYVSATEPK
jgi:hypothetical protein